MRERPILFSGPMVRAILDGKKKQTRRLVKFPTEWTAPCAGCGCCHGNPYSGKTLSSWTRCKCVRPSAVACPYGQPGDRLWVRETFAACRHGAKHPDCIEFKADGDPEGLKWKPSIHMPRWASRLTLAVEAVRVERLQDITEEDARAEGVDRQLVFAQDTVRSTHHDGFMVAWQSINGARASWSSNPFVWVISFRRVSR